MWPKDEDKKCRRKSGQKAGAERITGPDGLHQLDSPWMNTNQRNNWQAILRPLHTIQQAPNKQDVMAI